MSWFRSSIPNPRDLLRTRNEAKLPLAWDHDGHHTETINFTKFHNCSQIRSGLDHSSHDALKNEKSTRLTLKLSENNTEDSDSPQIFKLLRPERSDGTQVRIEELSRNYLAGNPCWRGTETCNVNALTLPNRQFTNFTECTAELGILLPVNDPHFSFWALRTFIFGQRTGHTSSNGFKQTCHHELTFSHRFQFELKMSRHRIAMNLSTRALCGMQPVLVTNRDCSTSRFTLETFIAVMHFSSFSCSTMLDASCFSDAIISGCVKNIQFFKVSAARVTCPLDNEGTLTRYCQKAVVRGRVQGKWDDHIYGRCYTFQIWSKILISDFEKSAPESRLLSYLRA